MFAGTLVGGMEVGGTLVFAGALVGGMEVGGTLVFAGALVGVYRKFPKFKNLVRGIIHYQIKSRL